MTLETGEPEQPQQATDPNLPPLAIYYDDGTAERIEEHLVRLSALETTDGTDPDLVAMSHEILATYPGFVATSLATPMVIDLTPEQLEPPHLVVARRIRVRIQREQAQEAFSSRPTQRDQLLHDTVPLTAEQRSALWATWGWMGPLPN